MVITTTSFIFTTNTVFCQQSFPFKSGIVKYTEITFYGEKTDQVLYVDGSKTALEKYRNNKLYKISINDGEYIYSIFPESKKGRKDKITASLKETFSMLHQDEAIWKKNKISEEVILGKKCDVYQFITKYTNKKIWQWEDLVLKEEIFGKNGKINYRKIATDIKIDVPIPKDKFQVPTGITIKEIENWEDEQEWLKENKERQWEDVPKDVRKEIESSIQHKALEELSDLEEQWAQIPKEKKTKEAQKKFEEKAKKAYKSFGVDLDRSLKRAQHNANESAAVGSLLIIKGSCEIYKDFSGQGHYPPDLKTLADAKPPYIYSELGEGQKDGYKFVYTLTPKGYTIIANPITPGVTGTKRYFVDETGDIRFTSDGSEPTSNSKLLK